MPSIVEMIDEVISHIDDDSVIEKVGHKVKEMMSAYPLFAY
ncbi:MAG TPA: hypothetical protein PK976_08475 [Bacteroidales bacterium]|nr:hypothetical protein [Bacteroidales bacterium]